MSSPCAIAGKLDNFVLFSAETAAPVVAPTPLPTPVPANLCECVAQAGICAEDCTAYVGALSSDAKCMDAFAELVCVEGVEETFFGTPYYAMCPQDCPLDCSFGPGSEDQETIECLQKRIEVMDYQSGESVQECEDKSEDTRGQCDSVLSNIEALLQQGCSN